MQKKPDFREAFLALSDEPSDGEHPAAEVLAAYRTGGLEAGEHASVGRHLEGCRECAELARDLDLFTEPPAQGADDFEVEAFLRKLKPQLEPVAPQSTKAPGFYPFAMAATLILSTAASWWLSSEMTRRQVTHELSRPRAVEIFDLIEDASQRTGRPTPHLEIERQFGGVLILTPADPGNYPTYRVRILDASEVETTLDLVKDPDGDAFILLISPGSLEPGDYQVELEGGDGDRNEAIASYRLRVVDSP